MVHEGKPHNNEENLRRACIARGGTWENGVCFEADKDEPRRRGGLSPRDPGREELRQKQLREDPLFAEKLRVAQERAGVFVQAQAQEELKTTQQKAIEEERARLLAEEIPVRRELDPTISALEKVPVLGGTFGAIKDVIQGVVLKAITEGEYKEKFKKTLGVATPEELRTVAFTQIEKQEIERGLTASEQFGAIIEGIPIVGSLAQEYAGGLIETPSENAAEVVTNIRKEKRRLSNIETNVKLNYLPVAAAQIQITDIENNIQKLESRVKLLINNSPELKFNSDNVNTIETEILLAREKVFQAKLNVLEGAITDPTELELFRKLSQPEEGEVEEFKF